MPDIQSVVAEQTGGQASVCGDGFMSFSDDDVTPLFNTLRSDGPSNYTGVAHPTLDASRSHGSPSLTSCRARSSSCCRSRWLGGRRCSGMR